RSSAERAVFIDERACPAAITSQGATMAREAAKAAEADRVAEGFRTIHATNAGLMKELVTADFLGSIVQETTVEGTAKEQHYGVVGVPLFDFSGKRVGSLVGVRSLEGERRV